MNRATRHRTDDEQGSSDDAGPDAAGRVSHAGCIDLFLVGCFPGAEFTITELHFFPLVIENVEGLGRFG